jgi:protein-tyrosine-phosphatase
MAQAPRLRDRIFTLKEFVGDTQAPDIDDPLGTDIANYRQCVNEIDLACDRLLEKLQGETDGGGKRAAG